ncbi:MAG: aminoacyl-tRNA hydrolase [Bryobacterales bacterium]|nr:aminoacyl-tRNA hydrolase [Bryobacterales bacterium]
MSPASDGPWLIAGLGNPGPQYELTPHNLGFLVVDRLAERHGIRVTRKEAMSLVGSGRVAGTPVILVKPQTFMNLSGPAVKGMLAKEEIPVERLLLVYDELALPWRNLRIRPSGSAAGHNGVKSVIAACGTQEFPRLRLGIHPGHPVADGARFVLDPFRRAQLKELDELLDLASGAVESIIAEGAEKAMTRFNRRAPGSNEEDQ